MTEQNAVFEFLAGVLMWVMLLLMFVVLIGGAFMVYGIWRAYRD